MDWKEKAEAGRSISSRDENEVEQRIMTLREADEAAAKHLPIESGGIIYVRILEIGYKYTEDGRRVSFVRLKDRCGHSITDADPFRCKIAENHTEQEEEQ